jgi:putative membrane protein
MVYNNVFQAYSFGTLWIPGVMVATLVLAVSYLTLTGSFRYLFEQSEPVSHIQKTYFLTGLIIFYLALGSPLHLLGDRFLFSAHMLAQSLMYMIVPPLILLGIPQWVWHALLKNHPIKKVFVVLTNPILTILSFNVLFSIYHLPSVFDYVTSSDILHNLYHGLLLLSAFQMWWTIISPLPDLNSLSELRRIGFLIMNTLLLYPACVLIIFADTPMYSTFAGAPQILEILPPLHDQQLGGVLMKLIQEFVFIAALVFLFRKWFQKENAQGDLENQTVQSY